MEKSKYKGEVVAHLFRLQAPWTWDLAQRVIGLRDEAARAGDLAQVELCKKALAGDYAARIECVNALLAGSG